MADTLNAVVGKVFTHPATKEEYGPLRLPQGTKSFSTQEGISFDILAEDSCGNCFTTAKNGAVWFWDHETDDLTELASSVSDLVAHCADLKPVEFDPKQVKSAWIDPAFAKSLGMKVPEDGWIKKRSKSE